MKRRDFLRSSALSAILAGVGTTIPGALSARDRKTATSKEVDEIPPYKNFTFPSSGKFKILQLTDTHYIKGDPRSRRALENVTEMIQMERPDLIIHTGDIIFGTPAQESALEILQPLVDSGIPFAVALGNHDSDFGIERGRMYELVRSLPGNINTPPKEGLTGFSNDIITLGSPEGRKWVFYLFDSGNMITIDGHWWYDYVHFDQVAWYRKESERIRSENGGVPVPAIAFMHIPPKEYEQVSRENGRQIIGNFCEEPCTSDFNSGLVCSMKEMGDVEAIVCGHDHDCDYVMRKGPMSYIYGRFSGCDTVYNNLGRSGARVFEFTLGEEGFRTWVRLWGGAIEQDIFIRKDFEHMHEVEKLEMKRRFPAPEQQ